MKEAKNLKWYKKLINKQFLQVSGLCSTPILSNLPKRSVQIYRAQYGDAILVPPRETPIWRPDANYFTLTTFAMKRITFR